MARKLLEVKGLRTVFHTHRGRIIAVNGMDFHLNRGKVLGVVGESGCGKSVTAFSILQLISHPGLIEAGEILFEKHDLLKLPLRELNQIRGDRISMIFQEPMTSLNPVFNVENQIGEALTLHQGLKGTERRERCLELLNAVSIARPKQVLKNFPHHLSGGMRQRVMIAMALSCQPSLLIADEPTTALDVTIQARILEMMKQLCDNIQASILFITHDLGVIAEMADRVLVMYAGSIVEENSVTEIFDNPLHPYTKDLLASRPLAGTGKRLSSIKGTVPDLFHLSGGCPYAPRCSRAMNLCFKKVPPEMTYRNSRVKCFLYKENTAH